jgi:hypothetical protein
MGHYHYARRYQLGLTVTKHSAHIDGQMDGRTDSTRTILQAQLSLHKLSWANQIQSRKLEIQSLELEEMKSQQQN